MTFLYITANRLAFGEIHRSAFNSKHFSRWDEMFVDSSDELAVYHHLMVEDGAVPLAFHVEKRMMRQVADRRGIGSGLIIHAKLIVRSQGVGHRDVEVSRESVKSVWKDDMQHYGVVGHRFDIPNHPVNAELSAMKSIAVVILIKLIFIAVEFKLSVSDAVGITAHHSAEISLTFIINIAVNLVITQDDIVVIAFIVGHPQRHDTSAVIRHLHGQITVFQSVKRHFLAIDFCLKIIDIHKINLPFLCTTEKHHRAKRKNQNFLHF